MVVKRMVNMRLDAALVDAIDEVAGERGRTAWIEAACRRELPFHAREKLSAEYALQRDLAVDGEAFVTTDGQRRIAPEDVRKAMRTQDHRKGATAGVGSTNLRPPTADPLDMPPETRAKMDEIVAAGGLCEPGPSDAQRGHVTLVVHEHLFKLVPTVGRMRCACGTWKP